MWSYQTKLIPYIFTTRNPLTARQGENRVPKDTFSLLPLFLLHEKHLLAVQSWDGSQGFMLAGQTLCHWATAQLQLYFSFLCFVLHARACMLTWVWNYYVEVWMRVHASAQAPWCVYRSQRTTSDGRPRLPPHLTRVFWLWFAAARVKISWLSSFWGLSCLCLLSHHGSTRITHTYFYAWLYVGFEDSNTSLHAYIKYYMLYPMIPLLSIFVEFL